MAETLPKDKTNRATDAPDLSALVDQTSRTLVDLDQRIQLMRQDLANMMQEAGAQVPGGQNPSWPPVGAWPHSGVASQDPHAPQSTQPWGQSGPSWHAMDPFAGRLPPIGTPYTQHLPDAPQQGSSQYAAYAGQGRTSHIEPHQAPPGVTNAAEAVAERGTGAMSGAGLAGAGSEQGKMPPVAREPPGDILDMGQEFQIRLDMPGVKKDDLDIMVTDRSVIVTGQVQPDTGDGVVVVSERAPTQYRRTITLPNDIQTSECHAKLKDGVLAIIVPKKVPTDGPRHINVAYA